MRGKIARLAVLMALSGSPLAYADRAAAQSQQTRTSSYAVTIPAQSLDATLMEIARKTNHQIVFTDRRIVETRSRSISGRLTVEQMLARALAGTGFEYRLGENRTIRILSEKSPAMTRVSDNSLAQAEATASPTRSAAPSPPQPQTEGDPIVVTGTAIRGSSVADVLPVTVVDEDYIDGTGAMSGSELFQSLPQAGFVAFNETRTTGGVNDARGDTASINLRGIGTGNTLVLLNGRRMVLHPGTQAENLVPVTSVNTNAIPVMGIERLEVLRDGASAIYGTDAVAGVINTLLKSDLKGFTAEVQAGFAEDSPLYEVTAAALGGFDFNDGATNLSLFATYTQREGMMARDRVFSRSADHRDLVTGTEFEGDTDFDNRSTSTPFGVFQASGFGTIQQNGTQLSNSSGTFHIQPNTNPGCRVQYTPGLCFDDAGFSAADDRNLRYNINDERSLQSDLKRINTFAFLNHDFGNGVELFAEGGYYRGETDQLREQAAPLSAARITIPRTNYYNPFGPTTLNGSPNPNRLPGLNIPAEGLDLTITGYRLVDVGPRRINVVNDSFRLLGGLRGQIGETWDWEGAVLYSEAHTDDTTANRVSSALFQQALARSTPDAYNPFNGGNLADFPNGDATPNPQSVIDSFTIDVYRRSKTSLALADFKVSTNSLFELPAGGIGLATGVEVRREGFADNRDPRLDGTITYTDSVTGITNESDVLGSSGTRDSSGSREVYSVFAEVAIPLVSPEMDIPLVDSFDVQLAGRFESYSDVGEIFRPKVAASWYLFPGLQLRGAYSEGFRAPNLPQVFETGLERQNTRLDYIKCEADLRSGTIATFDDCSRSQPVVSSRSGNRDLEPETSQNLSAGITFEPAFIRGLTFTVDYWRIKQNKVVGIFGDNNQIAYDYLLRVQGSSNPAVVRAAPTPDEVAAFAGTGIDPAGEILFVSDDYLNLLPRTAEGLDLGLYYRSPETGIGRFNFSFNAARLITFDQEPSDAAQAILDAQAAGEIDGGFTVAGVQSLIEQEGRPKWRFSSNLTWRLGNFGLGVFGNYVSAVDDGNAFLADGTPFRIDDHFTLNAYAQYTLPGLTEDGVRLRLGVRNLLDADPPLADEDFGYLGELHSALPRYIYFNVRVGF